MNDNKFEDTKDSMLASGCFLILILPFILCVIGYVMNFQNLVQYWPNCPVDATVVEVIKLLPFRWIVSAVGVFLIPVGIITGFIW